MNEFGLTASLCSRCTTKVPKSEGLQTASLAVMVWGISSCWVHAGFSLGGFSRVSAVTEMVSAGTAHLSPDGLSPSKG